MELLGHREYALVIFITNSVGTRHNRILILRGLCLCLRVLTACVFKHSTFYQTFGECVSLCVMCSRAM